jgi:F-type H+-transporting ATPase subunit b
MLDIQPSLLLFEIVIFLSMIAVLNKIFYSPVLSFMDSRRETLSKDSEKVDSNAKELEALEDEANEILAHAKAQSSATRGEIIAAAKAETENIIKDAKKSATDAVQAFRHELDGEKENLRVTLMANASVYKEAIKTSITK